MRKGEISMPICYIFASGEYGNQWPDVQKGDLCIAADGGYAQMQAHGLEPDLVVGDFDSLGYVPPHPHIVRHPVEKDDTDTALALSEGWSRGYRTFHIYGALGGRLDHTLANVQLLCGLAGQGGQGVLIGPGMTVTAVHNGTLELEGEPGQTLSVFCWGEPAQGITLEGLKYLLHGATLTCDVPRGVSNEFLGGPARITVEQGTLVVMVVA